MKMTNRIHGDAIIRGTCLQMCSEKEIKLRETRDLIHWIEADQGKRNVCIKSRMVKEYTRPAAGKSDPVPSDLRPGPILLTTTDYLILQVLPMTERPWHCIYEYIFDRLRSIRQDMTIQRLSDSLAVAVLERTIRIMIYAQYRLCEEKLDNFVPKINSGHIQECLKKLLNLYEKPGNCRCHEGEFLSYYLLFNLGNTEALQYGLTRKQLCRTSPELNTALSMSRAWWLGNYIRCLKLSRNLPVLQLCAFHRHRYSVIRRGLCVMSAGYHSKALTVSHTDMQDLLHLNDRRELERLAEICGIQVLLAGLKFNKTDFKQDAVLPVSRHHLVDEDLGWEDIPQLLCGTACSCH